MAEVWVFLHTPVKAVIIVGEEETDELITPRERNGFTGEEGWEDREKKREAERVVCVKKKASPCASFSSFTSVIHPPFSLSFPHDLCS